MNTSNETILHVDLNKLEENFNYLKEKLNPETKIIAVVKAFAYGHGDVEISKKLEKLGVYALWVSDFEEGVILRKSGIKTKIIVANPGSKSYNKIIKYRLDVVIYNQKLLDLYCAKNNNVNIHIKFNTGMNRYGFETNEIKSISEKLHSNKHLNLLSICSHLACSERKENTKFTISQLKKFQKINISFQENYGFKYDVHILNSHGVIHFHEFQFNMARIGIGLYGSATDNNLQQISKLTSIVTQVRSISLGEAIGYGPSYFAKKDMKIVLVPVGYADGLNRKLSNGVGSVFIQGNECCDMGYKVL